MFTNRFCSLQKKGSKTLQQQHQPSKSVVTEKIITNNKNDNNSSSSSDSDNEEKNVSHVLPTFTTSPVVDVYHALQPVLYPLLELCHDGRYTEDNEHVGTWEYDEKTSILFLKPDAHRRNSLPHRYELRQSRNNNKKWMLFSVERHWETNFVPQAIFEKDRPMPQQEHQQ